MLTLPCRLALTALLTGLLTPLAAAPDLGPGPSYPPPRTAPASLNTRLFTWESDGFQSVKLELTGNDLRLTLVPAPHWVADRVPATSVAFRHRANPDVLWSLSWRSYEGFLPEISPQAMAGYVRGLRLTHRDRFTWLPTNEEFSYPELRGMTLFQQPLVVRYRLAPPPPRPTADTDTPPPPPLEVWDFFIEIDERSFLMASFQAPAPMAAAAFSLFEEIIVTLERPE